MSFALRTELYAEAIARLPKTGQHILAHQTPDLVVVYQAYNHQIADYAVAHQAFEGSGFSYERMSWIKPNFLWMMYRCGWATKLNQERVLALWMKKADFELILRQAVFSSFNASQYASPEQWQEELRRKPVRLQWDPDHSPYGAKLTRRAIQLGLKGAVLENFGKYQLTAIQDITEFVREQGRHVERQDLNQLVLPRKPSTNSRTTACASSSGSINSASCPVSD